MKTMTSAYANKLLRTLDEEKSFYLNLEEESHAYVAAVGETPVIPEYDFSETTSKINEINQKIQIIKHAINKANVMADISVGNQVYSVDVLLIRMAQLNRRKYKMNEFRQMQTKERKENYSYSARNVVPEYRYVNFDLEDVKKEYDRISEEIMEMQLMLDKYNQTVEFEVNI